MKFLVDARLSFLDEYASENMQSMLVEIFFWTTTYSIYANVMSHCFRAIFRKLPIWKLARVRGGVFCGNGRDDSVLLSILGCHHCCAAFLMYLGLIRDDADLWRHGYLLETGFEIADIIAMILKTYPYHHWEGHKDDIKLAMFFHHLPGITLCSFVMESGLYTNSHLQAIGLWLLAGAAFSCLAGVLIYSLDFDNQMTLVAITFNLSVAFFVYCRFYIWPIEA